MSHFFDITYTVTVMMMQIGTKTLIISFGTETFLKVENVKLLLLEDYLNSNRNMILD